MKRMWRKADLAINGSADLLRVSPRRLPKSIAPVTTIKSTSPVWGLIQRLEEPQRAEDLQAAFPGLAVDKIIPGLSRAGLIIPADQDEGAYFFDWAFRVFLRRSESVANDLIGVGSDLAGATGADSWDSVLDSLDGLLQQVARLEPVAKSCKSRMIDRQAEALGITGQSHDLRLNLGCGIQHLPGWINMDLRPSDFRLNLRWDLPFPDRSASHVYAAYVLEHLYLEEAQSLLREIRRVLMPGGKLRLLVPDIGACIEAYSTGDEAFFAGRAQYWPWASECATPLEHFLTYAGGSLRISDLTGHKYGYDFQTLSHHLAHAGFGRVTRSTLNGSGDPVLNVDRGSARWGVDGRLYTLFVDAEALSGP